MKPAPRLPPFYRKEHVRKAEHTALLQVLYQTQDEAKDQLKFDEAERNR